MGLVGYAWGVHIIIYYVFGPYRPPVQTCLYGPFERTVQWVVRTGLCQQIYKRTDGNSATWKWIHVFVNTREWFTCTSRCSNHTVTCPVLTVTWTADGFWRSLDSRCIRSEETTVSNRFVNATNYVSYGGVSVHMVWLVDWYLCGIQSFEGTELCLYI